jgi:hypothetical protein
LAQPFRDAQLFPIHGESITNAVLDANFGPDLTPGDREFLIALAPSLEELQFLWTLQVVLAGGEFRDAYERALAKVYDTGDLPTHAARFARDYPEFELGRLHRLGVRRLQNAPPEAEHLIESWKREEESLFEILDRVDEPRREERSTVQRG